ncbi:MAG: hypothetical protein WC887_02090 [Candidatus Paceibacterota bacterium]|jgi:hypothetical protein
MNPVRSQALRLRILGRSYNEIRKEISVSKSTLSLWLRDVVLSDKARERLDSRMRSEGSKKLITLNKLQTHKAEQRAKLMQSQGKKSLPALDKKDLALVGAVLYWAEGYKRLKIKNGKERMGHTISFVNSDAEMITVFVHFLREILGIPAEKIRLSMRLYAHINEDEARTYWIRVTSLPHKNFFKTTYLVSGASKGKRPYNRLPWGTLQVEVCDTAKFHYLIGMIEGVKKELLHGTMFALPG